MHFLLIIFLPWKEGIKTVEKHIIAMQLIEKLKSLLISRYRQFVFTISIEVEFMTASLKSKVVFLLMFSLHN